MGRTAAAELDLAMLDAHLHLWQRKPGAYAWLGPEFGALYDDFPPEVAEAEIQAARVTGAVLVQADDTVEDSNYMFDIVGRYDWALGVVAWLPLDDPDRSSELLEEYVAQKSLCGARQLVHNDPRDNFYRLPEVNDVAELLAARGLPLDIPDSWPRDLVQVADLAAAHPHLTVVLDHVGKPPVDPRAFNEFCVILEAFSESPKTVVKFSGLDHPARPFTLDNVLPLWELCLELFGPERMMLGSDWPITVNYGGYQPTWNTLRALLKRVEPNARRAIEEGTARRVYGLGSK